ncbi:MAG: 4Fe-4S binding protein [bacterium]
MNKIVTIDRKKCIACGKCAELCPKKILYIDEKENICRVTDETKCDKRKGCEAVCPEDAIKIK